MALHLNLDHDSRPHRLHSRPSSALSGSPQVPPDEGDGTGCGTGGSADTENGAGCGPIQRERTDCRTDRSGGGQEASLKPEHGAVSVRFHPPLQRTGLDGGVGARAEHPDLPRAARATWLPGGIRTAG